MRWGLNLYTVYPFNFYDLQRCSRSAVGSDRDVDGSGETACRYGDAYSHTLREILCRLGDFKEVPLPSTLARERRRKGLLSA